MLDDDYDGNQYRNPWRDKPRYRLQKYNTRGQRLDCAAEDIIFPLYNTVFFNKPHVTRFFREHMVSELGEYCSLPDGPVFRLNETPETRLAK